MKCSVKLVIGEEELTIGPGLIVLLENICESSTVSEAALKMGISYSKAWKIVRLGEKALSKELVSRKSGGFGGGNSLVSPYGRFLIQAYRKTEEQLLNFAKEKCRENFSVFV